jgi:hypothetical protein
MTLRLLEMSNFSNDRKRKSKEEEEKIISFKRIEQYEQGQLIHFFLFFGLLFFNLDLFLFLSFRLLLFSFSFPHRRRQLTNCQKALGNNPIDNPIII